jgi:hypothetical protein
VGRIFAVRKVQGRDPNRYAGIAWAILVEFDRAWRERPVFGKIRSMPGASTGKKLNSKKYIEQMGLLPQQGSLLFRKLSQALIVLRLATYLTRSRP